MRINNTYIKTGYFWLPNNSEKKIPGVLTIKNGGGIELEVIDLFKDNIKSLNGEDDFNRIIGHIEDDGLVTLDDCFYTTKSISFGGISKSKICINKVLSGVAYDAQEEVTFESLSFSVDCFNEWVSISGIKVENNWETNTTSINYSPPENIKIYLNNGMSLEIYFSYTLPTASNVSEVKITQNALFKIKSTFPTPLNKFIEIAHKLTNLMCFAIDDIVTLQDVTATSLEIYREYSNGKKHLIPIKVYYKSIPFTEKAVKKSWHQMLFVFNTIKSNFQDVVNNWLDAYEVIDPALNLYFSVKTGSQKYIDSQFLSLVQGLETYHRRTNSDTIMHSSEFDNLVSTLVDFCPESHKEWLQGRLKHGNEINLGQRIKKTIEPFKSLFGNSKDRNKLIRKIVDTRNYLTHYSKELRDSAATDDELWIICQKMEVILQLHFLKVIGFNDSEIHDVVQNSRPMHYKLKEI
ncbi:HEPN domain-containing protein [Thiothrix unzii]|uniref:ApeA N-terminal domain-containing protein n=1 Tax=Thiothrix unzii TaxID=111769 RepID=A0A975FCR5_9GAMM|nr:HEPN domain-containing protein [Thiothrix unzii]QTR55480.1 hypothetical protein J9260_18450 [Thiothrix unzii]QTR55487.1 hypothetical protein J9260_18410 [Thiothrix unzii]